MGKFAKKVYDALEVYLAVAIFALLIATVAIQVFMRYVLNMPSPGLFELSIYAFVWVIYLGGALAVRYDQHMRFDLIYRTFKPRSRLIFDLVFDGLTNAVLVILLPPSFLYTLKVYPIKASALRIPWTFLLIVYPVFLLLVIAHNFTSLFCALRELRGGEGRPKEELPWE